MKKVFLFIIGLVSLFLLLGLGWVLTSDGSYDISRSIEIDADAKTIFEQVAVHKNYVQWMPWAEKDTNAVYAFSNESYGVGSWYTWSGNKDVGQGKLTSKSLTPYSAIVNEIEFISPTRGKSEGYWTFEEKEGKTKVIWGYRGKEDSFSGKIVARMMDKMIGGDFEKGLNNLRKLAESMPDLKTIYSRLEAFDTMSMPNQVFYGFLHQVKIGSEEMHQAYRDDIPRAMQALSKEGLSMMDDFFPSALYTKWDEKTGEAEFYIGSFINQKIKNREGLLPVNVSKSKVLKVSHFGPYEKLELAHKKIDDYMKLHAIEFGGLVWELYTNDPTKVPPSEIRTDVFYQIK